MTTGDFCPCGREEHAPLHLLDAIRDVYPTEFEAILYELRHDTQLQCWILERWGATLYLHRNGDVLSGAP